MSENKGIHVVLEYDLRNEDVQHIVNAINSIRGVINCKLLPVNEVDYNARQRVRWELHEKFSKLLRDILGF